MKTSKISRLSFVMLAALALVSCGSDDPVWADPEAHDKTEQLQEQYSPFIVGTWHYEKAFDEKRAFEQLTFNADGTLSGIRVWQTRQVVTINGQETYTDWEDMPYENGTFTGTWSLQWERNMSGVGENRLFLYAQWDEQSPVYAYSHICLFGFANATNLQFAGWWQNSDGWTIYERGKAEPTFLLTPGSEAI